MAAKKKQQLTIEEKLKQALVPEEQQPYKIPDNWCWTIIENINDYKSQILNPKSNLEEKFELYSVPSFDFSHPEILQGKEIGSNKYIVKKDDILLCKINPRINRVWMVKQYTNLLKIASSEWIVIRNKYLDKNFLRYYFTSEYFRNKLCENVSGVGGSLTRAKPTLVKLYEVPIAPLNEQQRIVNIIESLFTKLDKAKELIQSTINKFEQNKMAILHEAFTGELTAKWRKENNLTLDSWENICLGKGLFPMKTRKPSGKTFRYIDIDAIDNKKQIVKEPKVILTERAPSRASRAVENGDVLFSMVRPYLKNIALIDEKLSDCIASTGFYVCKCKPNLNAKFLYYLLCFDKTIDYLMQFMKGDNSPSIRKDDLLNMEINLPTIEEQQEIVNILDKIFIKYDKIKDLQAQIDKIEFLKKSILAKAFRGELGTNDPNEKSAEVLLK